MFFPMHVGSPDLQSHRQTQEKDIVFESVVTDEQEYIFSAHNNFWGCMSFDFKLNQSWLNAE